MVGRREHQPLFEREPLWYKDAIFYEVHVRAFYDSNADGIGDFRGLVEKLDYIQDLGVTTIWLLPFYPSPLRDDGYDIADYTNVHPDYGTLRDVRRFVREAHRRGLHVVTELVCNHTSDEHPWFQRARRAKPGSVWRNYYVWSDTPDKYRDARIIFKDFERSNWTWDPVAGAYYWHRFYSHQPDLNYDNPRVRREIFRILDFWLDMGIDGLRLDAIPYLYEREGTNCENLPETHAFLKELRAHIDERFSDRMLLAEANQWPEDAVQYFGDGDECHMAFHFPLMPRMFMALRMEDRFPIIDILAQTPAIPDNCQWALFLRNHDELTLEMVTDDERDYMYRVYANDPQMRINLGIRRRLAPLLGNNRRRIELMNGLLFSLPGTPVIYYGDEIGMGDNIYLGDRDGVRTPMQWTADRNAGFSEAKRQQLYLPVIVDAEYHYEAVNVEAQQNNPYSLLWWMKRLIALRKRYRAFGRGSLEFLYPENRKVLAYIRRYEDEQILVVANLSRFVQAVELDLSEFQGLMPVEMFGHIEFPPVTDQPYFLTLGPHSFYWFIMEPQRVAGDRIEITTERDTIQTVTVARDWQEVFEGRGLERLADVLPTYLPTRRWFGGKARKIKGAVILDVIPLPNGNKPAYAVVTQVDYREGDSEHYLLLMSAADITEGAEILEAAPHAAVARVRARSGAEWLLFDALVDPAIGHTLLDVIATRRRVKGMAGEIVGDRASYLRRNQASRDELEPRIMHAEQSNTSIVYGDRLVLKLYRRLHPGVNPDLELNRYLTARRFPNTPPFAGSIEYRRKGGEPMTLGLLQGFVPNEGDAWTYTLDSLGRFFERALTVPTELTSEPVRAATLLDLADSEAPDEAHALLEGYLSDAHRLGQRTAEMHLALSSNTEDPAFTPEPMTVFDQRSLYQSMRTLTLQVLETLRRRVNALEQPLQEEARAVLAAEQEILQRFHAVRSERLSGVRIRIHGDLHLGQVLYTGNDFVMIDFEGEPARPISERRRKRSAITDVAGMLRSFHYATHAALLRAQDQGIVRDADLVTLEPAAQFWYQWVAVSFLQGYLSTAQGAPFVPSNRRDLEILLDALLLEKAVYEVGYELNNRPDWLRIPLAGILAILGRSAVPEH